MSSYHSNFSYLNKNSKNDFGWTVASIDADNGEMDSYLSQEQVYTDSYSGRRRILYGTKWNAVATVKITVIKNNGSDFSLSECRNAYRWLTGNPQASWLDLYSNGALKYSFLVTCSDVKPYKLDARTVALVIYFESISPWAYSPSHSITLDLSQNFEVSDEGVLYSTHGEVSLAISPDGSGILYNENREVELQLDDGALYSDVLPNDMQNSEDKFVMEINNPTDDLYSYVYLDTVIHNNNSTFLKIHNKTTGETTEIYNLDANEIITINADNFIISDKPNKIFGNSFNFVWPRLVPGTNQISISSDGVGTLEFTYRYPVKIGDCAMTINASGADMYYEDCMDDVVVKPISWNDITHTPTTIEGYGITNAYNMAQVDHKLDEGIDQQELYNTLESILNS